MIVVLIQTSVYNDIEVISSIGDHGVVLDAALLVREERQPCVASRKRLDVAHHQRFDEVQSILAGDSEWQLLINGIKR